MLQLNLGIIITVITVILTGCSGLSKSDQARLTPYRPNKLPDTIRQCQPQCVTDLGLTIYKLGNQVKIVMPSHYMFFDNSSHLKPYGLVLMDQAVRYINFHDKSAIKVSAYTDNQFGDQSTQALTNNRAGRVISYLRKRNLMANLVYSDGQGGRNPVAFHNTNTARMANNRIELSFRYKGYIYPEDDHHS